MKDCVLMRTEDNPNLEVDWDTFEGIDRHVEQRKSVEDMKDVIPVCIFVVHRDVHIYNLI